jgi:hypothetical protein
MCVFCNRLLQQTLADVQVAHCKAPQQHAPRCRTPRFPAHALFAVCRRHKPRTLRCARETRGERSPAACIPNLCAQTSRRPLTPLPPTPIQLHKGFIYATAHVRDVDGQDFIRNGIIRDGSLPVGIHAGFEVAPGDASDIEVANAYAWGSLALLFSDGKQSYSALSIAEGERKRIQYAKHDSYHPAGTACNSSKRNPVLLSHDDTRYQVEDVSYKRSRCRSAGKSERQV